MEGMEGPIYVVYADYDMVHDITLVGPFDNTEEADKQEAPFGCITLNYVNLTPVKKEDKMMKSGDRVMIPRSDGTRSPANILHDHGPTITVTLEERGCHNQPQEKQVQKGDVTLIPFRYSHIAGSVYQLDKTCESCKKNHFGVVG